MSDKSITSPQETHLWMVERTSAALKHCEHAVDTLRRVAERASRYRLDGLEAGTFELRVRLAAVTDDLRSLVRVLRAQLFADPD